MQLEYAKDPVWANEEKTAIDLWIKWDKIETEFHFTAMPTDFEQHGRLIFEQASQGAFGAIKDYVAPVEPESIIDESVVTNE